MVRSVTAGVPSASSSPGNRVAGPLLDGVDRGGQTLLELLGQRDVAASGRACWAPGESAVCRKARTAGRALRRPRSWSRRSRRSRARSGTRPASVVWYRLFRSSFRSLPWPVTCTLLIGRGHRLGAQRHRLTAAGVDDLRHAEPAALGERRLDVGHRVRRVLGGVGDALAAAGAGADTAVERLGGLLAVRAVGGGDQVLLEVLGGAGLVGTEVHDDRARPGAACPG